MRDYIVNGVPLRDPLGQWYVDYTRSDLAGSAARTVPGQQPYGYHGDPAPREGFFTTSQETIVLNVVGSTKDEFNALLRGFQGLFGRPTFDVLSAPQRSALGNGSARAQQMFSVSSSLVRRALGRRIGSIAVERIDEAAARLTIVWENLWAFWRSYDSYTSASAALTTSPQDIDLAATADDSEAPIASALIRIKGPIALNGYVLIRDRGTARSVRYAAKTALGASEYVLIDAATLRARLLTTDTWSMVSGTDVSNRISAGQMLYFTPGEVLSFPGGGEWFVRVDSSGYTSGSTAVEVRMQRSYLS